jgi:hypothetical protein
VKINRALSKTVTVEMAFVSTSKVTAVELFVGKVAGVSDKA